MSKMSQLHAELEMSAAELGFENLEEAEKVGYRPDYTTGKLYLHEPTANALKEMEEAHKAWLKARDEAIHKLEMTLENADLDDVDNIQNAIDFIRGMKYDT